MKAEEKIRLLEKKLTGAGKVIVAFSGGVDSTYLLNKSVETLGRANVIAVTAKSEVLPDEEYDEAVKTAGKIGAVHMTVEKKELENPAFTSNPADRCYHCKKELLIKLIEIGKERGIEYIAEGSNASDTIDYRPGIKAVEELSCHSPLMESGLTKDEIRAFSKEAGLKTWDKPSSPCLASRIPYGNIITKESLKLIEEAEKFVREFGVKQIRVRHEEKTARIEVSPEEISIVMDNKDEISKKLKKLGYLFVALDLDGYNQGSLNKAVFK